jgi:hypothetical protein
MAEIVIGLASSHSPQLSSGVEWWEDHAERDRKNPALLGKDGEFYTYGQVLAGADPSVLSELTPEVWQAKHDRAQAAVEELARRLTKARVDVLLVVGDDQREIFRDEGIPVFGFFLGDELVDVAPDAGRRKKIAGGIQAAYWARHGEQPTAHPTSAPLTRHIVEALVDADFDVLTFTRQGRDTTLGHAFTFPRYRLRLPPTTPIIPVFLNTYIPPNVPSAERCYRLGQAIARAVRSWPEDIRVGVVASGGLSHFVIDEALDRRVLDALVSGEPEPLTTLPRKLMRSGTSEILNWVAAAGALEELHASVVDYVPGYRSPAGTGTGMAFVHWE